MKRRAGRRKKMNVDREPNGRIQRVTIDGEQVSKFELDAMTWKRRQINPSLSSEEARKPEHGSVVAAWLEHSKKVASRSLGQPNPIGFTQMQYDAAMRYAQLQRDWLAAIGAVRARSSSEFGGVGGHAPDPFIATVERREKTTIDAFKAARRAVLECGSPLGMMAIETIVIENQPAEDMRGDLRMALNALSRHWGWQVAA